MSTVSRAQGRTLRERGAAAVELAIVLPLVLLLVGGIIDWGRFMFAQAQVTNAAREGARALSLGSTVGPVGTPGTAKARYSTSVFAAQGQFTVRYWAVAANGSTTELTTDPGTACTAGSPLGTAARVTVVGNSDGTGFKWFLLGPAMRLLRGDITVQPNATAEAACTGK